MLYFITCLWENIIPLMYFMKLINILPFIFVIWAAIRITCSMSYYSDVPLNLDIFSKRATPRSTPRFFVCRHMYITYVYQMVAAYIFLYAAMSTKGYVHLIVSEIYSFKLLLLSCCLTSSLVGVGIEPGTSLFYLSQFFFRSKPVGHSD